MTEPTPEPATSPLSHEARAKITALALDTNSLGHRHLDLEVLAEWGRRCSDSGLELWLPDVVLAEWAEHAAEMFDTARLAAADERGWLARLGIEPKWPFSNRYEVIEHVLAQARATLGVRVLELDPEDAREALFDQVLLRAPGARRKTVKTGAADSAWLRTVARAAGDDLPTVLVVSANRSDVESLCERLGWPPPPIISRLFDVPRVLKLYDPATPGQTMALCTAIAAALPTDVSAEGGHLDFGRVDRLLLGRELTEYVDDGLADFVQEGLLVSIDELAGVEGVLVDTDGTTFFAELYLLGTASVQTAGADNSGDTLYEEFDVPNVLVRLRAEVSVAEGALQRLAGDGDVHVFARQETARRANGGLHWAKAALNLVPGLDVGAFPGPDGGRHEVTVNGHAVELTCTTEDKRWDLTAQVDGDVVAVLSCAPSRGRWGLRGHDAFELLLEPDAPDANPAWQFAAILLQALKSAA